LNDRLELAQAKPIELIVCGGAALIALALVDRPTRDVDVLARMQRRADGSAYMEEIPEIFPFLQDAAIQVARDLGLDEQWLNRGPAFLAKRKFPEGFQGRLKLKNYGKNLKIHFIDRLDQIYFKLLATASDEPGTSRHFDDLLALEPSANEIEKAAKWAIQLDSSEPIRQALKNILKALGYESIAEKF